jgi:hypothetical protein
MHGLLVSGLAAADLVAGAGSGASSQDRAALRVVTLGQGSSSFPTTPLSKSVGPETSATSASRPAITPEPSSGPRGAKAAVAKAAVERRLASLIISAPVRKLPRRFVDPTTGLIKNNVQVVCRRRTLQSFLCVVRLPNRAPKESLYVRYRGGRNGHGVFAWYGYKAGSRR